MPLDGKAETPAELRKEFPAADCEFIEALTKGICDAMRTFVKDQFAIRDAELASLRTEVADLRSQHDALNERAMQFAGIYSRGLTYEKGAFVSHGGSSWFAIRRNSGCVPGQSPDDWIMTSKSTEPPRHLRPVNIKLTGTGT